MLTDDLRQAIREHKTALLALLSQPTPAHTAATVPSPQEVCAHQEHVPSSPPPYPSHPVGAPFRPGKGFGSTGGMTRPHGLPLP